MSLLCLGKHGKAIIGPFKCCVNGLPEFSHLLLDFFNIAVLILIFMMLYDSKNIQKAIYNV